MPASSRARRSGVSPRSLSLASNSPACACSVPVALQALNQPPAAWLAARLGVDQARARRALMLTHWVDHERAVARHGYPKDNALPPPLPARMADAGYVQAMIEAEREEEDPDGVLLLALARWLERIG